MSAKDLFRKPMNEADEPLPGGPPPGRRPLKMTGRSVRVPYHPPGSEMGGEDFPPGGEDIARMTGGREPRGQFSPKELSQLKDVLLLMLSVNSPSDAEVVQALMSGKDLDPGQLQHILDEVRNIKLPETHEALLNKIHSQLNP